MTRSYRIGGEVDAAQPLWEVQGAPDKAFVDFQNDVTVADVERAEREGGPQPHY